MRLQGGLDQCPSSLSPLAGLTTGDIPVNVTLQAGPPVVPSDEFVCLELAWVPGNWCVMMRSDDVTSQYFILGDANATLPVHEITVPHPFR